MRFAKIEGILIKMLGRLPMGYDPTRGDHEIEADNAIDLATADIQEYVKQEMKKMVKSPKTAQEQCPKELADDIKIVYGFCCGYGFKERQIHTAIENYGKEK